MVNEVYIFVQLIAFSIGLWVADHKPRLLIALLFGSVLAHPISLISGTPLWKDMPLSFNWNLMLAKWILVVLFATIPITLIKLGKKELHSYIDIYQGVIAFNIAWTLCYGVFSNIGISLQSLLAVLLIISLIVRSIKFWRIKGAVGKKDQKGMIVFYNTPMMWLILYSIWNASFVVTTFGTYALTQILLFWLAMLYLKGSSKANYDYPLSYHFGYTRALTLGIFIASNNIMGIFSYFREGLQVKIISSSESWIIFILLLVTALAGFDLWKALRQEDLYKDTGVEEGQGSKY